jgi:non-specific serine/threonine protein kinase
MSLFEQVDDRAGMATVLLQQGFAALYRGDDARAAALVEDSLPLLRDLGDAIAVARAFHVLGMAARHQGELRRSEMLFKVALEVAWGRGARLEVAQCFVCLAGLACKLNHSERAVRLFGAAENLRLAIGTDLPSGIRVDYDPDVARVRNQLEGQVFAEMWAAGQAMTLEQAVAYARAEPSGDGQNTRDRGTDPSDRPLTSLQAAKRKYGGLTARERHVAILVAQGKSNATIAEELVVTVRTVEAHITHIFRKLDFSSRAQLAVWAVDRGLAQAPKHA